MSLIKIQDVAFVRFNAPDLEAMESFLLDFGLVRAGRNDNALYMRGTGSDPFVHVTHRGEPGFAGVAFKAAALDDLEALARAGGVAIQPLDGPGGGYSVTLRDPDGFAIEVVADRAPANAIETAPTAPLNDGFTQPRRNAPKRIGSGPSRVKRLGHLVLGVTDFARAEEWYKARFGLITSDEWPEGQPSRGAFLRCDRGATPTDHHTIGIMGGGAARFGHAAFEVTDFDDLMRGNAHLLAANRQHDWGVGRHFLGSQIFDYWRDPWGHTVEHWTDGDLMTADWGSRQVPVEIVRAVQWGDPLRVAP
jgi:catechol 2,3-dioxygenase-like lactoylglutathione lyase family enzyme